MKVDDNKIYKTEANAKDDPDDSFVFGFCDNDDNQINSSMY